MGDKDFFLSPDDAMTMGDINYMRTSKRTRRTFPKTLKNKDGFAIENEVSSMEDRSNLYQGSNTNQNTTVNTVFNPTPSTQSQPGITGGLRLIRLNPFKMLHQLQKSVVKQIAVWTCSAIWLRTSVNRKLISS